MKFLANENFPMPSIGLLRKAGFEVVSIVEQSPGISDEKVLARAVSEKLIILTFDRDYGELIFKYVNDLPPAVVYFRRKGALPEDAGRMLLHYINSEKVVLEGYFSVIDNSGIRQRKLK